MDQYRNDSLPRDDDGRLPGVIEFRPFDGSEPSIRQLAEAIKSMEQDPDETELVAIIPGTDGRYIRFGITDRGRFAYVYDGPCPT